MKSFAHGVDDIEAGDRARTASVPDAFEGEGKADELRVLRRKVILLKELAIELLSEMEVLQLSDAREDGADRGCLRDKVDRLEVELITRALREADWNQAEAARRLGIKPNTLSYKIKCHGIDLIKSQRFSTHGRDYN
jgi:transcriptional regulator with GAF, ATPase, and Fis domain